MKNWVKKLKIKDFQGADFVEITPDENNHCVLIEGDNEAGKSRILRGLYYLVCGGSIPAKPVTEGKEQADLYAEIGDYKIRAVLKADKNKQPMLQVTAADGSKVKSPRAWLSERITENTIDPYKIANMDDKEFHIFIKRVMKLDFTEEEKAEQLNYTRRTEVHKQLMSDKAKLEEYEKLPDLDTSVRHEKIIIKEQDDVIEHNRDIENKQYELAKVQREIKEIPPKVKAAEEEMKERINKLKDQIEYIEKSFIEEKETFAVDDKQLRSVEQNVLKELEKLKPIDPEPIAKELEKAREQTNLQSKYDRQHELTTALRESQERHDSLTEEVEKARAAKLDKIKNAKMPAADLEVRDEGIFYKDIPFEQHSKSRKIKLSMEIAKALTPDIPIMFVEDGAVIGEKIRNEMVTIASEFGIQLFFEDFRTTPSGKENSFFIK